MGIGDWGLGIRLNPQSPIPNPQSPIPNFQKKFKKNYDLNNFLFNILNIYKINYIFF